MSSSGGFRAKLKKKLGFSHKSSSDEKLPLTKEASNPSLAASSSGNKAEADPVLPQKVAESRFDVPDSSPGQDNSATNVNLLVVAHPARTDNTQQRAPDPGVQEGSERADGQDASTALSTSLNSSDEPIPPAEPYGLAGQQFDFSFSKIESKGGDIASHNVINAYHGTVNVISDLHARIEAILRPHIAAASQLGAFEKEHCFPGTRLGVFETIRTWARKPENSLQGNNCLCVIGVPGSGKSTIAASVASDLLQLRQNDPQLHIVHYFIRRGVDSTTSARLIFPTLAYQISLLLPQFAERLLENLGNVTTSINNGVHEAARALFIDPMRNSQQRVLLVIDALDELSRAEAFASALSGIISGLPDNIRLIITTRNENNILLNLGPDLLSKISLEIRTTDSILEVRQFLATKLTQEIKANFGDHPDWTSWPNNSQVNSLSEKAAGLFVWAATAASWILTRLKRRGRAGRDGLIGDVSKKGMENLDVLYAFILGQLLVDTDDDDTEYLDGMKLVLGFIAVAAKPLPLSATQQFLALDDDVFDMLWFIQAARSVLVVGMAPITVETVPQMHKSFFDFLTTSSKAGRFRIEAQGQHGHAALRCFSIMNTHLHFNMLDLQSSFLSNGQVADPPIAERADRLPLELLYSCELWGHHLQQSSSMEPRILRAFDFYLRNQFLFWLEVMTGAGLLQAAGRTLSWLFDSSAVSTNVPNQDTFLPFARDAFRFFSAFRPVFEDSIPHIYLSALALAPSHSLSANAYLHSMSQPQIPPAIGRTSEWDACIGILDEHEDYVTSLSISPDGRWIASSSRDQTIRIWDSRSGACVIGSLLGHTDEVNSVAFSPDGLRIASGSSDYSIRVWDSQSGVCVLGPLTGHENSVEVVAFSPDGQQIASGSVDWTIRIWDAHTGACILGPLEGDNAIYSVIFSPDGRRIASSGEGWAITVWDASSGERVVTMDDDAEYVWQVAFSPTESRIASACDSNTISVWDADTGAHVLGPLEGHRNVVQSIAYSPDGRRIISGSRDKTIRIWDAQTGTCLMDPLKGHTEHVVGLEFTPDARRIVSCSFDKTIRIWDAEYHPDHTHNPQPLPGHTEPITTAAFLPDGNRIISGSNDGTVGLWDAQSGACIVGPLKGHVRPVRAVAVSSDFARIAAVGDLRAVRVWSVADGTCTSSTTIPLPAGVEEDVEDDQVMLAAIMLVADTEDFVCVSSYDSFSSYLVLWHGPGSEPIGPITRDQSSFCSVNFSPNGEQFVTGAYGGTIEVWNARTGTRQSVFDPQLSHVGNQSSAFSLDGKRIVAACADYSIRVWDVDSGECVLGPLKHDMQHSQICCPAFSQDGSHIVSGSLEGSIVVWNAQTGDLAAGPFMDTSFINSVGFSPDGRRVVSGNQDGMIRVWELHLPFAVVSASGSSEPHQERAPPMLPWTPLYNESATLREDGWVLGTNHELLFWLPYQYRRRVWLPQNSLVIGGYAVRVDVSRLVDGTEWLRSFRSRK